MNKIYKIAIVGGGASGIACATELLSKDNAFLGEEILIFEKNDRLGKKLSVSGNGQGNISNACISGNNYSGNADFISAFLKNLEKSPLTEYFKNFNIPTVVKENGRIYPVSLQANAVTDILRFYLQNKNVQIKFNTPIKDISQNNGVFTVISDSGEKFFAENVVLAFGGKSAKQFGTDGTAYVLAQKFGHSVTELFPSLVQLKADKLVIKGLNGVKTHAKLSAFDGDKLLKTATGDLLFTEYGISGNAVFQVSDKIVSATCPYIFADFLPDLAETEIADILKSRKDCGYIPKEEIFTGIVNKKIGLSVIKSSNTATEEELAHNIKNFRINITGNLGFNYAQVTKGGIKTEDVCENSYESKLQKGLFIVGEALNVDGECGGYNLTFAFLSGVVAAKTLKNRR